MGMINVLFKVKVAVLILGHATDVLKYLRKICGVDDQGLGVLKNT